jgi:DNA repair exonuclease SbcCD ATPase subunit
VLEADTSLQVLLAAKTTQEADAILAEKFDTSGNVALEPSLEALLSRSTSRTQGAAGSVGGESSLGGAASSVNLAGPGSATAEKLAAEVECYKQQLAELQEELAVTAAGRQEHAAKLEAQLQATVEEKAAAQAAQQELQQQKAAAEEAQQQLLLQINVLNQEAADLKQLNVKLQEAQAADADLLAQTAAVQQELGEIKQQWQAVQLQNQALQQQADRVAGLEAEVANLQQQLQELLAHKQSVQDAWTEADLVSTGGNAGSRSTAGSSAAVSAVRAATHNLLLQSNPFEVSQRHASAGIVIACFQTGQTLRQPTGTACPPAAADN